MEIIGIDRDFAMQLIKVLALELKCKYCGVGITKENFGGVFSRPSRVCCDNIVCLAEAIDDTNEKKIDEIIDGKSVLKEIKNESTFN